MTFDDFYALRGTRIIGTHEEICRECFLAGKDIERQQDEVLDHIRKHYARDDNEIRTAALNTEPTEEKLDATQERP